MTKKEMIDEMARGLKGVDKENRMKNSKARVNEVYSWYLKSEKKAKDKAFCLAVLTVW